MKIVKKSLICSVCVIGLLSVCLICMTSKNSPAEYLKSHAYNGVAEILYQEEIDDTCWIFFYINNVGNISCGIVKEQAFSYKLLKLSGDLSPNKKQDNYIFSAFKDNETERWIDWGIVSDSSIKRILVNGEEMNITVPTVYGYRICWYIREGKIKDSHIYDELFD